MRALRRTQKPTDCRHGVAQEFSKQLVSRGPRLSISERILPTASDLRSEILRLKHAGVTHLLAVGLPFQYVSIFRVSRELKFEPQFLSLRNIEDASLTRVGIEQGRVVYSYSFDAQADNSHTQEFVRVTNQAPLSPQDGVLPGFHK